MLSEIRQRKANAAWYHLYEKYLCLRGPEADFIIDEELASENKEQDHTGNDL